MDAKVKHLSIRVPWHDTGWDGRVCAAPSSNASCLVLPRISESRDDAAEDRASGTPWGELAPQALPPCVRENAGFLRPTELGFTLSHPYVGRSPAHENLRNTPIRLPAFSASCIPFRWMRRDNAEEIAARNEVDYQPELEDTADEEIGFKAGWVQHGHNQRGLLHGFFAAVEPDVSLAFFYAKRVPHVDDDGRVIIAVARVLSVGPILDYRADGRNVLDTCAWERMVQHSLHPPRFDGVRLPYHEALVRAGEEPSFDAGSLVAFAPDDGWTQFSYGTEHVSHDVAISSLVACQSMLERAAESLPGGRAKDLAWVSDRLGELWTLRGPCPGLATALQAFGVPNGTIVVRRLSENLRDGEDPWPVVAQLFAGEHKASDAFPEIGPSLRQKWTSLSDERRALLKLLSRFDLAPDQAARFLHPEVRSRAGIDATDAEILANPYRLYELDREQAEPVPVLTVDHGAFPAEAVRRDHPLPLPSAMQDALDIRRARALMIDELERIADDGDTLQRAALIAERVRHQPLDPPCPIDGDMLAAYGDGLEPLIAPQPLSDGTPGFQLNRLRQTGEVIRSAVERRLRGKRHEVDAGWRELIDRALDQPINTAAPDAESEERARTEKAAALRELAESRFSVLVGPAGTGKTTLLKALCDEPSVEASGVLLLAPTGKARVRLRQALDRPAQTIAQFLLGVGRYLPEVGAYRLSDQPRCDSYGTVIVDEASMLTEDQLAATIDAFSGVARFILVGDPRQLPPIGPGRPFVDLVRRVQPDTSTSARIGPGYAELTVPRRHAEGPAGSLVRAEERDDLLLAEWFSGRPPSPAADEVWERLRSGDLDPTLAVVSWADEKDLHAKLLALLTDELALESETDQAGFERSLGGTEFDERVFFWAARNGEPGAAASAETWQILDPVRGRAHGVRELNRLLQRRFRAGAREWSRSRGRKIPRPMGPEEIVWGDKVISVVNDSNRKVYPAEGADRYVANGDIGIAVGQYKTKGMKRAPWRLEVEYASQPGFKYEYGRWDFSQESAPPLELAYALTVHKAQGSEFGRTFVVIPNPCRVLSRELLYTALTRQRTRVVVLYQGDIGELRDFADPRRSETATRLTNLFVAPKLVDVGQDRFLEAGLIHRTSTGLLVRSKSEVIIAELLHERGIEFAYERPLVAPNGSRRLPDFTIDDAESGITIYWEHLGMLSDPAYARRWERKIAWYEAQGILPPSTSRPAGGPGGVLLETRDDANGGIDVAAIRMQLERVLPS